MISLSLYTSLFKFNGSTYVKQQPDGTYKRIFKNLTKQDLEDHLNHKHVLALYPSVNGNCQLGCIDLDIPHDLANDREQWDILEEKLHIITEFMDDLGVSGYLVEKTGGRGYHIWVFSEIIESTRMYKLLRRILEGVHIEAEVFPADTIKGGLGKAIRPPLGTHLKYQGSRSTIVDSKTLKPITLTEELITSLLQDKLDAQFYNDIGIHTDDDQYSFEKTEYDSIPKLESFDNVLKNLRPCFQGVYEDKVETDSGQGWVFMSAAAAEMMYVGGTLEHAHQYFCVQKQYNKTITNRHMGPIMKKSLSPYRCVKLQEECSNYVLGYCDECPIMKQDNLYNEIEKTIDKTKKKESDNITETLKQFNHIGSMVKDMVSGDTYNMITSDYNNGKKWAIVSFLEQSIHTDGVRVNVITNLLETKNILMGRLKSAGINFLDNPSNLELCPYREKYEKLGYVPSIICKNCDKYMKIKNLIQPLTDEFIEMSDCQISGDISFYEKLADKYDTCPKWIYMALLIGTVNEPMALLMTDAKVKHHLFIPGSPLIPVMQSDMLFCTVIDQIDIVSRDIPRKTITQREISNHMRELDIIDLNELSEIEKKIEDNLALGDTTGPVLKQIISLEYLKTFEYLEKALDSGIVRKVSNGTDDNHIWYYDLISEHELNFNLNDIVAKEQNPRLYDSIVKRIQDMKIECNGIDADVTYSPKSFREIIEDITGNCNILGVTSTPTEIDTVDNKWYKSFGDIDKIMSTTIYGIPVSVSIQGIPINSNTVILSQKNNDEICDFGMYRDPDDMILDLIQQCRGNIAKGLKTYYQHTAADSIKAARKDGADKIFVANPSLFRSLGFKVITDNKES